MLRDLEPMYSYLLNFHLVVLEYFVNKMPSSMQFYYK